MGLIHIMERSDDTARFNEAMKRAKSGLMEACEIWEDMKAELSERGGYGERSSYRRRDDWGGEYEERRGRDSRGRYM
jgi:hypothetical protein